MRATRLALIGSQPRSGFRAVPPNHLRSGSPTRRASYEQQLRPNYVEVIRADGSVEEYAVITALKVNEGDLIRIHTGTGAGWGDPKDRRRELLLDDLRNGYLSPEAAREIDGLDAT